MAPAIRVPGFASLRAARRLPIRAFRRTRGRATLEDVFGSLSVLKLFRRSLIERLGLRFEEGLAAHEDGLFTTIAYLESDGISVVAHYACYYVRRGNRRTMSVDPLEYLEVIDRRIQAVEVRRPPGGELDRLMQRHIVDVLRTFSSRWSRLEPDRRRQAFDLGARIVAQWQSSARSLDTSPGQALRLYCLEHGLETELIDIVRCPASAARQDAITERNRRYARYPHFRDASGIPDRCFELRRRSPVRARLVRGWRRVVAAVDRRRRRPTSTRGPGPR